MGKRIIVELNNEFYNDDNKEEIHKYIDSNNKLLEVVTFYKNKITDFYQNKTWDKYKKLTNEYELIFTSPNAGHNISKYTPVSRSFFKLWELLHDFKSDFFQNQNSFRSLFIAEGPGGFAEALMKFRQDYYINDVHNDEQWGITLKSNSDKNIPDWKYKSSKLNIVYGQDDTGNIYNIDNIHHLKNTLGVNSMDLITADGGFDFSSDFNSQEEMSLRLLTCEVYCALVMQRPKGTFVVKVFDIFTPYSLKLINILSDNYETVKMIKPLTSRPANSEKYLLCSGFKGDIKYVDIVKVLVECNWDDGVSEYMMDVLESVTINNNVTKNIILFNTLYISRQVAYIQKTIDYINRFMHHTHSENGGIKKIIESHIDKVRKWCTQYDIPT